MPGNESSAWRLSLCYLRKCRHRTDFGGVESVHFPSRSGGATGVGDVFRTAKLRLVGLWNHPPSWFALCEETLAEASRDRIPTVAAGVTFFVLLAMFPGIASVVSLYGLFADRTSIAHVLDAVAPYVPSGAITVLNNDLHRLIAQKPEKLDIAFFGGFIVATWSASGGLKGLIDGLNAAYETQEERSFFTLSIVAFALTLAAFAFGTIVLALAVVIPIVVRHSWVLRDLAIPFEILRIPVAFVLCALLLELVYRLGPDRETRRRQFVSWGSAIAAALWMSATLLFSWYVQNFGSYDRVYGNLGAAVGFLTWIWILLLILLVCAELNCEIERRRRRPLK